MRGRPPAPQGIIIHRWQIIMYQRIAMDEFKPGPCLQRITLRAHAGGEGLRHQKWPQALAAAQGTMPHRGDQSIRSHDLAGSWRIGQKMRQSGLDGGGRLRQGICEFCLRHAPAPVGRIPAQQTLAVAILMSHLFGMTPRAQPVPRSRTPLLRRLTRALAVTCLIALALLLAGRFLPLPSTLMLARWASGNEVVRDWRPISAISPSLVRAVVASEDQKFCSHWGVDFQELGAVLSDPDGPSRGASTIHDADRQERPFSGRAGR